MAKNTLLRVVQRYLDYVDAFPIDSIADSEESIQAANIAEHVYYTLIDKYWDFQTKTNVESLDPSNDTDLPAVMYMPSNLRRMQETRVSYNISEDGVKWKTVNYCPPEDFLTLVQGRTTDPDNTEVMEVNGTPFVILNDKAPDWYTTFDDNMLVFDSYDNTKGTTLQESMTQVVYQSSDVFYIDDDFVIPLPDHMHSGYQDMVIAECAESLRGMQLPSVSRRARWFVATLQQDQRRVGNKHSKKIKYGRR